MTLQNAYSRGMSLKYACPRSSLDGQHKKQSRASMQRPFRDWWDSLAVALRVHESKGITRRWT